jgi:adenosylhomocysteine nucleosidase
VTLLIACALPEELGSNPLPNNTPVVWTGVGKVNTAIAMTRAIVQYRPQLVINFGTAGRVSGDVQGLVEVGQVIQRDMVAEPLAPRGQTPFDKAPSVLRSQSPASVVCASGDSFVTQHDPWLIEQGAHVVDMELFALAMACHQHGVAWRSFKYITDDANEVAGKDWATQVSLGQQLFRSWFEAYVT